MDLVGRTRNALLWKRAYELSAGGNPKDALIVIRSVGQPYAGATRWKLFEVYNLAMAGEHVDGLRAASSLIAALSEHQNLGPNSAYFLAFAKWCAMYCFAKLFPSTEIPTRFLVDPRSVSKVGVSPRWLRTFPLREQ